MSTPSPWSGRLHPLYRLPLDLILMITDHLDPETFISLAFATYPLLRHHGLAPAMSVQRLSQLVNRSRLPFMFRLLPLPTELLLQTMRFLSPVDLIWFVVANYQHLAATGIAPPLTGDRIRTLRAACQES